MIKSKIVKQKKKYIIRTELPEVEFTTSIGCHINCKLCPQELFIKRYKQISDINILTFKNFRKLIDKIPKDVVILFSGMTEPWLNKDCSKMVLYAYNTGHTNIKIFTTAVGMTPEDIDKIKHIPFRQFVLHLPDVFGITEIKDTPAYIKVLEKIAKSRLQGFYVVTFERTFESLIKLFGEIQPVGIMGRAGTINHVKKVERKKGRIFCSMYNKPNHFIIAPNGTVSLCCMDWRLKHILGNLFRDSYEDLYKTIEYRKIIKGLIDDKIDIVCRQCERATEGLVEGEEIKDDKCKDIRTD